MNSVLKSIHSAKDICLLLENYGGFKSHEIIVCCLITPNSPRRERFETSLNGGARSKKASALTLL
ncbi:hypothetical protein [Helicobacter pylori]|uniref:hypothetical protein n=1 Tax=Helicobacter pylori TaxID=210 RepID=UPI001E405095|nr:hypothetical protein [Helicobacter pylori]